LSLTERAVKATLHIGSLLLGGRRLSIQLEVLSLLFDTPVVRACCVGVRGALTAHHLE